MKKVAIIDYGVGNTFSLQCALKRIGVNSIVSRRSDAIRNADCVILPGVGAANKAMKSLKEDGLNEVIISLNQPVLGICLGMQLLGNYSEEGNTECLGVIPFETKKMNVDLALPHMGWNKLKPNEKVGWLNGLNDTYMYFVHGYSIALGEYTIGECIYEASFSAVVQKANFYGVQFHPEKSGKYGERLLSNFLAIENVN